VHRQPRRLVDDEQVFVLEHPSQHHRLGPEGAAFVGGHEFDHQPLASAHAARGRSFDEPVNTRVARLQQVLQVAARKLRREGDQCLVQALAMQRSGHNAFTRFDLDLAFALAAVVCFGGQGKGNRKGVPIIRLLRTVRQHST